MFAALIVFNGIFVLHLCDLARSQLTDNYIPQAPLNYLICGSYVLIAERNRNLILE